jgi:hypothetical protein
MPKWIKTLLKSHAPPGMKTQLKSHTLPGMKTPLKSHPHPRHEISFSTPQGLSVKRSQVKASQQFDLSVLFY